MESVELHAADFGHLLFCDMRNICVKSPLWVMRYFVQGTRVLVDGDVGQPVVGQVQVAQVHQLVQSGGV